MFWVRFPLDIKPYVACRYPLVKKQLEDKNLAHFLQNKLMREN